MMFHAELDEYLVRTRARIKAITASRLLALLVAAVLVLTLLGGYVVPRVAYSASAVLVFRIALFLSVLVAALWGWRALVRMQRDDGATALEAALTEQNGRVRTLLGEQRKSASAVSALAQLLAADAWQVAQGQSITTALPARQLALPLGLAVIAAAGLLAVFNLANPFAAGAKHLWGAAAPATVSAAVAAGGIAVKPGDVSVRRNQDLNLAATVAGIERDVKVHVRFADGAAWETSPMERGVNGEYAFTLFAVREAARYFVTAGSLRTQEFQVSVVDLPQIESMQLTYDYPSWTGLRRKTEESGADIAAVAGTQVAMEIKTDKPMEGPLLVIDGAESALTQSGTVSRGRLTVKKEGVYRIATRFGNEIVPLTEDFQISVVADEKPNVEIIRPGRDYKATNLEEVPVGVKAQDDFRLESVELRYSVNAGPWRSEKLGAGTADVRAAALLRLEEMQQPGKNGETPLLVPGDLVSYFAVARDHTNTVQTDLFLIQVQPFELRFSQSQANSAGGGGGDQEEDEGAISQRQREVLLATWNLARNKDKSEGREAERDADSARMLAQVQKTLADQANTLVQRAGARNLTGSDENVTAFVKSLEEAAKAMRPAAENLEKQDLSAAVQHEQQALQHLLRAEATFRDIQVAMQGRSGSSGGGSQAGRDVSEMTELELDLEKNQYETEPQMTAQQKDKAQDETLQRLRELARRQEQLAREQARQREPNEAQRWQQEQLRREAEQLRQALQQMAEQRGSGQSQSGDATSAAADRVGEALRQMQARNNASGSARAGEELQRAREQLERGRQQADSERFSSLAERARALTDKQRESEEELRAAVMNRPPASIANPRNQAGAGMSFEQMQQLAESKREIQNSLEDLQRRMRGARQQAAEEAPRAAQQIENAAKEVEESGLIAGLARSAREIERGRGAQAATREGLITEAMENLQRNLEQAASVAAAESGAQGGQGQGRGGAEPGDLLAELGDLRRALQEAQSSGGQSGDGQGAGQAETAGTQDGPGRGRVGRLAITGNGREPLRGETRLSAQRLQQLREQLRNGAMAPADLSALQELSTRLRRTDGNPLAAERAKLLTMVNQLELAALRATRASNKNTPARAADVVDDSARYRDNVADYYRRLGSPNE
jgi:hypothetical protein